MLSLEQNYEHICLSSLQLSDGSIPSQIVSFDQGSHHTESSPMEVDEMRIVEGDKKVPEQTESGAQLWTADHYSTWLSNAEGGKAAVNAW